MKVSIDFSVFLEEGLAFGNVTGDMDMEIVPQSGDSILFSFSPTSEVKTIVGFTGIVKIIDRVISVGYGGGGLMLELEEVVVSGAEDAHKLMSAFESEFDFFSIEY